MLSLQCCQLRRHTSIRKITLSSRDLTDMTAISVWSSAREVSGSQNYSPSRCHDETTHPTRHGVANDEAGVNGLCESESQYLHAPYRHYGGRCTSTPVNDDSAECSSRFPFFSHADRLISPISQSRPVHTKSPSPRAALLLPSLSLPPSTHFVAFASSLSLDFGHPLFPTNYSLSFLKKLRFLNSTPFI